jgi:hypothetical protein
MVNITLSLDERLAQRARKVASGLGKSLSQLVRKHLERVTAASDDEFVSELRALSATARGLRRGWHFNRDEAHQRP